VILGDSARIATVIRSKSHAARPGPKKVWTCNTATKVRLDILRRTCIPGALRLIRICAELQATVKLTFISGAMLMRRGVGERLTYGTYFGTNLAFFSPFWTKSVIKLLTEPGPHRCMKTSENGGDEADFEKSCLIRDFFKRLGQHPNLLKIEKGKPS
jgi:hypothetical protein